MSKANGHDTTTDVVVADGALLADAADKAGGLWVGSNVIKAHIKQIERQHQVNGALIRAQAAWQAEVTAHRLQADQAQADLVKCLKEGDHTGARCCYQGADVLHLIRLGAE